MPLLVVASVLLGAAIGSFLNVVIYRVPEGQSLLTPPSRCPHCETPILKRHNIPVLGWLLIRGRCVQCGEPVSVRYPLVEATCAALFVAFAVRLVHADLASAIPAYWYLASIGLALAMIDLDVKRLPDAIVLPSYPVVGALLSLDALVRHDGGALIRAGLGGLALYAMYFALNFAYPAGMGWGDVKLSGVLGAVMAYLSWPTLAVGGFLAFLLGGVVGGAVMLTGRGTGKTALPFGPFMIVAAFTAILAAQPIWSVYTRATLGA